MFHLISAFVLSNFYESRDSIFWSRIDPSNAATIYKIDSKDKANATPVLRFKSIAGIFQTASRDGKYLLVFSSPAIPERKYLPEDSILRSRDIDSNYGIYLYILKSNHYVLRKHFSFRGTILGFSWCPVGNKVMIESCSGLMINDSIPPFRISILDAAIPRLKCIRKNDEESQFVYSWSSDGTKIIQRHRSVNSQGVLVDSAIQIRGMSIQNGHLEKPKRIQFNSDLVPFGQTVQRIYVNKPTDWIGLGAEFRPDSVAMVTGADRTKYFADCLNGKVLGWAPPNAVIDPFSDWTIEFASPEPLRLRNWRTGRILQFPILKGDK